MFLSMLHLFPLTLRKVLDLVLILSLVIVAYLLLRIILDHL